MSRHIHTLRIAAPHADHARRAALVLEDAFHTASLPDDARCIFVRRLDLGRMPAHLSPQALAQLIERRYALLSTQAVSGNDARAPRADVVAFADRGEALLHVARAMARGEPPAWFWPEAAPGWQADATGTDNLARMLERALAWAEGAPATRRLCAALLFDGQADLLDAALSPPLVRALCRKSGLSVDDGMRARTLWLDRVRAGWIAQIHPQHSAVHVSPSHAKFVDAVAPASSWHGENAAQAGAPHASHTAHEPAAPSPTLPRTRGRAQSLATRDGLAHGGDLSASPTTRTTTAPSPAPQGRAGVGASAVPDTQQPPDTPSARPTSTRLPSHAPQTPSAQAPRAPDIATPHPVRTAPGALTRHAGLLFAVPALIRLGMDDWLVRHPARHDLPPRLLLDLARRLRVPDDDPILDTFTSPAESGESDALPLAAWRQLLRRHCRVRARIGLADLAARDGRVVATATHLDVFLDPRSVDLRIRRAGMDVDPGWVPWLGHVLRFHYREAGDA